MRFEYEPLHYDFLFIVYFFLFTCQDFITFIVVYELQTVPLLFIMNNTSSIYDIFNKKGIAFANYMFVLYSLLSAGFLLVSFHFFFIHFFETDLHTLHQLPAHLFRDRSATIAVTCLFIAGSIKLALFPMHFWLTKAHVESPTICSVFLAAIALKSGFYLHYLFYPLFIYVDTFFLILVAFILIAGTISLSIDIFFQVDSKR